MFAQHPAALSASRSSCRALEGGGGGGLELFLRVSENRGP